MLVFVQKINIILVSFLLIIGCRGVRQGNTKFPDNPNIILIITDDQGYGDLSCHGSPDVSTPNIDKLYEQSIRFTDFHASPTCAPTRSAIMTGKAPFKNGITHTIYERERMALENITLTHELKSIGYVTGIFGKWHLGDEFEYQPDQRGFDEVFIHGAGGIGQKYAGSCADAPDNHYIDPIIKLNGKFVQTKGFCTDIFFKQALGWIKTQQDKDQPFFAYISTNAPHSPYIAPESNRKKFAAAGYSEAAQGFYGMVENIDDNVGLLLRKMDEWKLTDNTILIFMSDNGKAWFRNKEHLLRGDLPDTYNAGMKGYKGTIHEGGTKVPVFIRWPGEKYKATDIQVLASHYDLFPTIIEMCNGQVPDGIDGRSLVPLIKGDTAGWTDRYRFFHKGRWGPGENPDSFKYKDFSIRNERFRLVENEELYDVQADPGETVNVIEKHPEIVRNMMKAYEDWWEEVRPLMINEHAVYSGNEPPYIKEFNEQMDTEGIPDWNPSKL